MAEKILIVDDDVDSLKLIGLMLQRHGYEVVAANAGGQGLAKADAERPNLIILDVMMPDMNGLEVCRRLRANPNTQGIPIIMFTAKTLIDDKVKGFEAGADDYLTKPTHPAELASRVKAVLGRSAAAGGGDKKAANKGLTVGVIGAKGGVGTTTLALNLAASVVMQGREEPIVADFRLGAGTMGLLLGYGRSQGMASVLNKPVGEINERTVEGQIVTHTSGLRALVSSTRPREMQQAVSPEAAVATLNVLRSMGSPAIVDLGTGYSAVNAALLAEVEKTIVIVEPNGVTLRTATELLNEMQNEGVGGRLSVVVVNRMQSSLQTPWPEVENALGREIKAIISAAPELAFQSMENAMPMVMLQPNAIVSGQITKLADDLKSRIRSIASG